MKIHIFNSINSFVLIFVIAGIFIGVLVTAQFKSSVTPNSYLIDERNAQKELFLSFDKDRSLLKSQIAALNAQIALNQQKFEVNGQNTDIAILSDLKKDLGLTPAKGNGLEIILGEGPLNSANDPSDNTSLVHAADLRDLVNLIRTARPEAISINGQRIIVSTPINSVGNTILINNVHVSAPFKILAIGDTDLILDRIKDEKAYPDLYKRIQTQKIYFSIRNLAQLTTPMYDGEFLLKYSKKI